MVGGRVDGLVLAQRELVVLGLLQVGVPDPDAEQGERTDLAKSLVAVASEGPGADADDVRRLPLEQAFPDDQEAPLLVFCVNS